MENSEKDKKDILGHEKGRFRLCSDCGAFVVGACTYCQEDALSKMRWAWADTLKKVYPNTKDGHDLIRKERYQEPIEPEENEDGQL